MKIKKYCGTNHKSQFIGVMFALPFILGFIFVFANVIVSSVSFAFSDIKMTGNGYALSFIEIENFRYALRVNPTFIKILLSTLQSMLTSIPLILIVSLFVAVVLNSNIPGRTFFRAMFFLPVIVSTGLVSMMDMDNLVMSGISSAVSHNTQSGGFMSLGDISLFLQNLNFSPAFVKTVSNAATNITGIISLSGVQILIFLAGIQSISPSIYEAADVEGATAWEKFWKITLPMVIPMLVVNIIYSVIDFLTRDNTELMKLINSVAFDSGEFGYASAMSWIYSLCVAVILCMVIFIISRLSNQYQK